MSTAAQLSGAVAVSSAGIAAAAATLWLLRRPWRRSTPARVPAATLPRWLWLALHLAPGLAAPIAAACPAALTARIGRRLAGLDLDGVGAADWLAALVVIGAAATAAAVVAARLAGLPVLPVAAGAASLAVVAAGGWPARRHRERETEVLRGLPSYIDLLTICVEAGSTLTNGVRLVVEQSPDGPLRQYFARVLREIRSGRPRAEAFRRAAELSGVDALSALSSALAHGESSGISLGDVLRAQARQRSAERFTRAERLALQAPVRLLAPLVLFVFPCTFVVIALPILANVLELNR